MGMSRKVGALLLVVLCLLAFFPTFEISPLNLGAPVHTGGDMWQACRLLKSAMEEGTYYQVSHLGAPFVADHYGFPETFIIHLPLVWIFYHLTASHNIYLVYNLLYLTTYVAAGLACYAVSLRLGCRPFPALLLSWLYAYLPNHVERYDHYGISVYATAPLAIYYALLCLRNQKLSKKEWALAPLCALCGPYPSFFCCLIVLCSGLLGWLAQRSLAPIRQAILLCALVTLTFLLVLVPALGPSRPDEAFLPVRSPSDMLQWSLGLDHLILPAHARGGHPLSPLSRRYYQNFPPPKESNEAPYLGLVALVTAFGLALNLGKKHEYTRDLRTLACLIFLIGTTGGLGQLFSLVIGTTIRCYNRIYFHLAFVLLLALGLSLREVRWTSRRALGFALLMCLAWLEHVLSGPRNHPQEARTSVTSDQNFVGRLEKELPDMARIWQYPYVAYPESPPAFQEGSYGMGRLYAVSHQLHWSWGCLKGNSQERTQAAFSRLPLPTQLSILRQTGFAGVVVERRGYADGGKAQEADLQRQGLRPSLESPDKFLIFYPLEHPAVTQPQAAQIFVERVQRLAWGDQGLLDCSRGGSGLLFLGSGWSEPEPAGSWTVQKRAWIRLPLLPDKPKKCHITMLLTPFIVDERGQQLEILQEGKPLQHWQFSKRALSKIEFDAQLPALLELRVGNPHPPSSFGDSDTRNLGLLLKSLTVSKD